MCWAISIGYYCSCSYQRSSLRKEDSGKMCHLKRLKSCQVCYADTAYTYVLEFSFFMLGPSTEQSQMAKSELQTSWKEGNYACTHTSIKCVHNYYVYRVSYDNCRIFGMPFHIYYTSTMQGILWLSKVNRGIKQCLSCNCLHVHVRYRLFTGFAR